MINLTFTISEVRHRVSRMALDSTFGMISFRFVARCGSVRHFTELDEVAHDGSLPPTCDECLSVAHLRGWKPHPIDASLYYKGDLSGDCVLAPEAELLEQWKRSRGR